MVRTKRIFESSPILRILSLSIFLVMSLILLSSRQIFSTVDVQQVSSNGTEDHDSNRVTNGDNNNDGAFIVIIPENAAWSETINQRFDPSKITIPVGTEVTWINEDGLDHTITSGNWSNQGFDEIHDGRFYSGILSAGGSSSYTFTEPGVYSYFCSPHPWMNGFVLVEENDVTEGEQERRDGDLIGKNIAGSDDDESNNNEDDGDPYQEEEEIELFLPR